MANAAQRTAMQQGENSATFHQFAGAWGVALTLGLGAAAEAYRAPLAAKLEQGYTTGDYTTGKGAKSLRIARPTQGPDGPEVTVFTNDFKQRIWEYGAFNAFTRRYERREFWRETLNEQGPAMSAAFHRVFTQALQALAAA